MSTYQDEDAEVGKGDAQLWICRLEIDVGAVGKSLDFEDGLVISRGVPLI